MLWSLLKILLFVVIVASLTLGAGYLLEMGDVVLITVGGREFALTPIAAVIAALGLLLAVFVLLRLAGLTVATLRFLNGDETALSRYFHRRGEQKGYQALADGMLALASGEGRLAMRKAERAEKYLNRPAVTNLLVAQAAEMAGDTKRATEIYKALVADDRTRFVGIRGLMKQKLASGETETALKLAERAFAIRPQNEEVQDTLLQLQAQYADWNGARATLAAKLRSNALPRDVHKRRDAVLALADARSALARGELEAAALAAQEANRLSPDLVPAAVFAAQTLIAENKPKVAARVIKKAWDTQPHPDLAAAFAAIAPDETSTERLKRFRTLLSVHATHMENRLLEAELYITTEDFPAARRALGDLPETNPNARSLTIMAAIERGEGSEDHMVRAWLAKAITASRGPQWVCENCGHVHPEWQPLCASCDIFDTLAWQEVPQSLAALTGPTQMLPLIIGMLEAPSPDEIDAPGPNADIVDVEPESVIDAEDLSPDATEDEITFTTETARN
jgi:HemY protein